jgi:hypothetical protein
VWTGGHCPAAITNTANVGFSVSNLRQNNVFILKKHAKGIAARIFKLFHGYAIRIVDRVFPADPPYCRLERRHLELPGAPKNEIKP